MDTLAIIKRIELRLTELGMSKADFYKISGISSASYSQWNTGLYKPSPKKLQSAAVCLGLSYDYLCYGTTDETKSALAESSKHASLSISQQMPTLSQEEAELIRKFRYLDDRGRSAVLNVLNHEYESQAGENAASSTKEA